MTFEIDSRVINDCIIKSLEDFGIEFLGENKEHFINMLLFYISVKRKLTRSYYHLHLRSYDVFFSTIEFREILKKIEEDNSSFPVYYNNLGNIENIKESHECMLHDIIKNFNDCTYQKRIKVIPSIYYDGGFSSTKYEDLFDEIILNGIENFFRYRKAAERFDTLYGLQTPDGNTDIPVYLIAKIISYETGLKWSP
jgi:hypothetical protein